MIERNVFVDQATNEWDRVFNQIGFYQVKKGSDPCRSSFFEQRVVPCSNKREESINNEIKNIFERMIIINGV